MGYYGKHGYYAGSRGNFISGLGHWVTSAIAHVAPIAQHIPGLPAPVKAIAGAIAAHPVTAAVTGAAAAATTTAMIGRSGAQPGAMVVPGMRPGAGALPGGPALHLHVHGRRGGAGGRKRPRMNVCNPRALRRAIRRFKGFEHIARHVINFTHAKKVKRGYAKRPRRRTATA